VHISDTATSTKNTPSRPSPQTAMRGTSWSRNTPRAIGRTSPTSFQPCPASSARPKNLLAMFVSRVFDEAGSLPVFFGEFRNQTMTYTFLRQSRHPRLVSGERHHGHLRPSRAWRVTISCKRLLTILNSLSWRDIASLRAGATHLKS
jgi:hypothetical protein